MVDLIENIYELYALMGDKSTNEDREDVLGRLIKIMQSSVLPYDTHIDYVVDFVRSRRGSIEDALCNLERRYHLS